MFGGVGRHGGRVKWSFCIPVLSYSLPLPMSFCVGTGQFLVSWVLLGKSDGIPGHGEVMRIYSKYQKVYDAHLILCKSS